MSLNHRVLVALVRWLLTSVLGVVFVVTLSLALGASTWVALAIGSGVGWVAIRATEAAQ